MSLQDATLDAIYAELKRRKVPFLLATIQGDECTYEAGCDIRDLGTILEVVSDDVMKKMGYVPVPGSGYKVNE